MKDFRTSGLHAHMFAVYIVLSLVLFTCRGKGTSSSKRGIIASWDAVQLPILKPYELIRLNGDVGWTLNLHGSPGSISNAHLLAVGQNFILIYSGETYCNNRKVNNAWFIIIPSDSSEYCFTSKDEFQSKLNELTIKNYLFRDIDSTVQRSRDGNSITW